jgi:hypothetical protein
VEYWHDREFFDPISLLKRTPARDLGQWTYARKDPSQLVLRYAMADEVIEKKEEVEKKPEHKPEHHDPTLPPGGPEGVEPEFSEKFMKCMAHHYPKMGEMHSKYGMGMGGPAAVAVPGPVLPPPPIHPEPPMHMSKAEQDRLTKIEEAINAVRTQTVAPTQYQKELEEMRAWKATMEVEHRRTQYERDLTSLMARGRKISLVKEMNRVKDYTPEQFAAHLELLEDMAPRDPVTATDGWLPTTASPRPVLRHDKKSDTFTAVGGPESGRQERTFGYAELEIADRYMMEHSTSTWEEAKAFAMGEGKTPVPVK